MKNSMKTISAIDDQVKIDSVADEVQTGIERDKEGESTVFHLSKFMAHAMPWIADRTFNTQNQISVRGQILIILTLGNFVNIKPEPEY